MMCSEALAGSTQQQLAIIWPGWHQTAGCHVDCGVAPCDTASIGSM